MSTRKPIKRKESGNRRAEEELRFKNALLSTQQETALDGILVVDENGGIISSNQRFADMWDIPSETMKSKSDERTLQAVMDRLANPENFLSKVKHLYEFRDETSRDELVLKDGKTFDRYSAPMFGANGKYYGRVWYFRDITDSKTAMDKIKSSEQRLRELSETKSQFVANASHELRTPLAIIRQFVYLLDSGIAGPLVDKQKDCTSAALRNCDRLAELINRMLDLARIEAGKVNIDHSRVEPSLLLIQSYTDFLPKMETKKQRLILETPNTLPAVCCDPQTITSVIIELLGNAHKFTPEGGKITLGCLQEGPFLRVYVEDNGPGIPLKDQERIFEAFAQVDRQEGPGAKGTGLGLTIIREIVKLNGGTLSVSSTPGNGSRFSFTLPLFITEKQLIHRVLVADNDKKSIHMIMQGLKRAGLQLDIRTASTGLQALVIAGTFHPHLVILDANLPDSLTPGVFKSLGRETLEKRGKVLMISTDQRILRSLVRQGVHDYLVKPFSVDQLLAKVALLLGNKPQGEVNTG